MTGIGLCDIVMVSCDLFDLASTWVEAVLSAAPLRPACQGSKREQRKTLRPSLRLSSWECSLMCVKQKLLARGSRQLSQCHKGYLEVSRSDACRRVPRNPAEDGATCRQILSVRVKREVRGVRFTAIWDFLVTPSCASYQPNAESVVVVPTLSSRSGTAGKA